MTINLSNDGRPNANQQQQEFDLLMADESVLLELNQPLLAWICYTLAKDLAIWGELERGSSAARANSRLTRQEATAFAQYLHDAIRDEDWRTEIPPLTRTRPKAA